jgi:CRISPR/Cas system CSM-associated protein Csm3 (group 7 of RAMP superfamily)
MRKMKKGILIKKGDSWHVSFTSNKEKPATMPVPVDIKLDRPKDDQRVEFDNAGGQINKIKYGGQVYNSKLSASQANNPNMQDNSRKPARAPYNFIPLNETIVSAQAIPDHDKYYLQDDRLETDDKKRYSGHINLEITNKTPFFIRGRDVETDHPGAHFFYCEKDKPVIPGSSLRGLTRSLVEIVSNSAFEFYAHKRKKIKVFLKVSKEHKNKWGKDLVSSIFGTTNKASTSVFFEDGISGNAKIGDISIPRILAEPKVSYYPSYLKQPHSFNTKEDDLLKWESKHGEIRGNKSYWHRETHDKNSPHYWKEPEPQISLKVLNKFLKQFKYPDVEQLINTYSDCIGKKTNNDGQFTHVLFLKEYHEFPKDLIKLFNHLFFLPKHIADKYKIGTAQFTPIAYIEPKATFTQRIRFENLSKEELGCLLFVLDLPKEPLMCHKLGLGKPLGLGSIRIEPELTLINRKERYMKLFDSEGWHEGIVNENTPSEDDLKNAFATFMNGKADIKCNDDWEELWKNERLKHLKEMLTYEHPIDESYYKGWLERTAYQELEEFKKRPVLPNPNEVADDKTYK